VPIPFADVGKAREKLGYDPQVGIEQGVEQFVAWWRHRGRGVDRLLRNDAVSLQHLSCGINLVILITFFRRFWDHLGKLLAIFALFYVVCVTRPSCATCELRRRCHG